MSWSVERWTNAGLDHAFGGRGERPPADALHLRQVHGDVVHEADPAQHGGLPPDAWAPGDGWITSGPTAAIRTADCVPVLLAALGDRVAAVVHAGWRGSAAGILDRAVERLGRDHGVGPGEVEVALGPAIGACCYEVGEEVRAAFERYPEGAPAFRREGTSLRLDLRTFLEARARSLGVARVERVGPCTACSPDALCSFRRDRDDGRQWTWAAWRRQRWRAGSSMVSQTTLARRLASAPSRRR